MAINLIVLIVILFYKLIIGFLLLTVLVTSLLNFLSYKIFNFKKVGIFIVSFRNFWSGLFGLQLISRLKTIKDSFP